MTTIRSLMLAQQARHEAWTHPATKRTTCSVCDDAWPCPDWVAADAVLAALDACPSYDGIVFYGDLAEFLGGEEIRARLIPDPEVS